MSDTEDVTDRERIEHFVRKLSADRLHAGRLRGTGGSFDLATLFAMRAEGLFTRTIDFLLWDCHGGSAEVVEQIGDSEPEPSDEQYTATVAEIVASVDDDPYYTGRFGSPRVSVEWSFALTPMGVVALWLPHNKGRLRELDDRLLSEVLSLLLAEAERRRLAENNDNGRDRAGEE